MEETGNCVMAAAKTLLQYMLCLLLWKAWTYLNVETKEEQNIFEEEWNRMPQVISVFDLFNCWYLHPEKLERN